MQRGGGWRFSQQKQENKGVQKTCYACDWTFSTFCSTASGFNPFSFSLSPLPAFNVSLCPAFSFTAPASACLPHHLPLSIFTATCCQPSAHPVCVPVPFSHPVSVSSVQITSSLGHLLFCFCNRMPLPGDLWALPG